MSLRPGAVNFDEKWRDLRETIDAVVHLKPVKRITWNDNISYPSNILYNYCQDFYIYTYTYIYIIIYIM